MILKMNLYINKPACEFMRSEKHVNTVKNGTHHQQKNTIAQLKHNETVFIFSSFCQQKQQQHDFSGKCFVERFSHETKIELKAKFGQSMNS